jgi:hypothetical protein
LARKTAHKCTLSYTMWRVKVNQKLQTLLAHHCSRVNKLNRCYACTLCVYEGASNHVSTLTSDEGPSQTLYIRSSIIVFQTLVMVLSRQLPKAHTSQGDTVTGTRFEQLMSSLVWHRLLMKKCSRHGQHEG